MNNKDDEKFIKEILKKVLNNNSEIPEEAKRDLRLLIDTEHDSERLLQKCLLYMLAYQLNL